MKTAAVRKKPEADEDQHANQRRVRACLKCATKFESAWFGERVCRPCKSGATWQTTSMDMIGSRAAR